MKRVLIVDDDPCVLRALRRLLGGEFEVQTAVCAAEALQLAETFRPDLVISDMSMPSMTGFELIEQLRRRDPRCDAVLLSGYDWAPPRELTMMLKPWDGEALLERVRAGPAAPILVSA